MKQTLLPAPLLLLLICCLFAARVAPAATVIWNGASSPDLNWSTAGNWSGGVVPTTADDVKFFDDGADPTIGNVNNIVNAGFAGTIQSLQYGQTNNNHTTLIESGKTLSVFGGLTVGTESNNGVQTVNAAITGAGASLVVSNSTANIVVRQASSTSGAGLRATLDLSGLDTFTAIVGRALIGSEAAIERPAGTLYLARTNLLRASGSAPALAVGGRGGNNNSGNSSLLYLGQTNAIFANSIMVGRGKQGGNSSILFNSAFANPVAYFRAADGASPISSWNISDSEGIGGTVNTRGSSDFTGGNVDILVDSMIVAKTDTGSGTGNPTGSLTLGQGTINANTLGLGYQSISSGNNAVGTANINGGTLNVNDTLELGHTTGGTGAAATHGVLNITSGTVRANIIIGGQGAGNNITVTTGTLAVTNSAGPGIDTLTLMDSTLELASISDAAVVVTNLVTGGSGNTIKIGLIPAITSYPATFRLIKYQGTIGGSGYDFAATGVPAPYTASLVDNAAGQSVDLVITAGPIAQAVTWVGTTNADWDTATRNWRVGTVSTNFFNNDFAVFDDTAPGATVINLSAMLLPGSVTVNNSILAYTFTGSGGIGGLGDLTKAGSGTLLINNAGANSYLGNTFINAGTVQVGSGGTSGSLASGAISNNASLVINRSDDLALANDISGSGVLTKNGAGMLTLNGANSFGGAVTVNQGTLKAGSSSALGTTNGITTVNNGATLDIGANSVNLGLERVVVSGNGVSGAGAIVNSSGNNAFVGPNVAFVTLAGNTTFGGTGRWDLRAAGGTAGDPATAALSTGGSAYSLTKVGPNTVNIVSVTMDNNLGDIDVQAGILGFEGNVTSFGDPTKTVTVRSNATLRFYALTNAFNKHIAVEDGGIIRNENNVNTVTGPMTISGNSTIDVGGTSLTLSNTISGTGNLIKISGSPLTLAGGNDTYTGNTTVSNGTLVLNEIINGGGTLTTVTNTTLAGTGTNSGPVIVGGTLSPGTSAGTFGSGDLTLQPGATLVFELNTTVTPGSGVNDLVEVAGNLTVNNNTIKPALLGTTLQTGTYRLIDYAGTLTGSFDPTVALGGGASRYSLSLSTATPHEVDLIVGGGAANLRWNSAGDPTWNIAAASNWFNLGTLAVDAFYQADSVLFDDSAVGTTIVDIPAGVGVTPSVITNDSTANSYTIGGAGKITGGTLIVKKGDSILNLGSTNDFTGTVTVEQGTLQIGNNSALGTTAGATVVKSGASLDVGNPAAAANAVNLGLEPITVSGDGQFGQGAIVNNSAVSQQNAVRVVTLAGNTRLGGNARWDIRGAGAALSTGGNAYNLTKVSANQVSLVGVNVDPKLGDIDVQGGIFSIETTTSSAGDPAKTVTVQSGATLQVFQLGVALDKHIVLNGDGATTTFNNASGANTVAGPISLNGSCLFNVGGTSLTLMNTVSGTGGLTKNGNNLLTMTAANPYLGDTFVNAGTLALTGTGAISASPNIVLTGTATVDVSGRSDGKLTLSSGQTLSGLGTIRGSLQVNAGATVSPGSAALGIAVGALTVTNAVILAGTNVMEIDKVGLTNDFIGGAASIQFGGTLNLVLLNDQFVQGDSFKLFDAGSYSGSFTIVPATPGTGLAWDTSELATTGTLKVGSPKPTIGTFQFAGGTVSFSGTGGPTNGTYSVLTSTNIALPVTNWSVLTSGTFDGNGNFNISAPSPSAAQRFFLLQTP